jgi:hypothetical protein
MNRFKLFSVLILSLIPSISFAQDKPEVTDKPESDSRADFEYESRLLQEETRILSEILSQGQVDEAFLKGYPRILRETLGEEQQISERVRVFGAVIEAGLTYQARDQILSEEDFKAMPMRPFKPGAPSDDRGADPGSSIEAEGQHIMDVEAEKQLQFRIQSSSSKKAIDLQVRNFEKRVIEQSRLVESGISAPPGLKGKFYVMWGYNRAWFGKTDSTFKTPEGTFTIHDSVGEDRPSPFDPKVYFNPSRLSIPQYNLTIGYWIKDRLGVEIGHDHMKWVFDRNRTYEITGEFSPTLYVPNPNPQFGWDGVMPVTFDQVKQTGDARWLSFEHTNGYNYVFAGLVYLQPIYHGPRNRFAVDARMGAGAGVLIPQTSVHMHRDQAWNWEGYDNQFHLAGGGGHANAALRFTAYDRFFFEATARASLIKVSNALVDQSGAILTQTPIAALELMGQIGYQANLVRKKRK